MTSEQDEQPSGNARIAAAFSSGRPALMPYMMGGFPDQQSARAIAEAYIESGADLIELGIPFSDPLADGPVIQAAGGASLAGGTTAIDVLSLAAEISARVPVVLMVYVNTVLSNGYEQFVTAAKSAGVAGLIVPDLPHEESIELRKVADAAQIALIPLVAPTTPPQRLAAIGADARGFVYVVSLTGTTGERSELAQGVAELVANVKTVCSVPVAVGFGISNAEQAADAAEAGADGVIVGSRLVRLAAESEQPAEAVRDEMVSLRIALDAVDKPAAAADR